MFKDIQTSVDSGVRNMAEKNVLKKLEKQDVSKEQVGSYKFAQLVDMEVDIIRNDGKKVGGGIAVGIGISLLSGGLF